MSANGLYGKCPTCSHVFLVAKLPMEMHKAAECAQRAYCVACGETKRIKIASDSEVAELERRIAAEVQS